MRVVERVIGFKRGTGGSAGVDYLKSTVTKKSVSAALGATFGIETRMSSVVNESTNGLLAYRREFPILEQRTYLASHSLGAMPWASALAIRGSTTRIGQKDGILAWDGEWWRSIEVFCDHLGAIINAPATSIVPMLNVTRAFAAIAVLRVFAAAQ